MVSEDVSRLGRSAAAANVPDSLWPSWRTLTIHGKKLLLHSALVTGLKHWHLRPSSRFYPKANFHEVVSKIPAGASIVMLFGEIDCREGILLAGGHSCMLMQSCNHAYIKREIMRM
jgi:hypothetical protein